ncbi:MAG: AAA-like domain-containing protein [Candidatus Aminicenantes bacterium]|nr:AAA-like domain-containing protein [Candidatus Aminicenantes bacterium]
MRKFSSYGPVDTDVHYYAPRKELIDLAYLRLVGEHPGKGGHYITAWAPRQTGKTWLMLQVLHRLEKEAQFDVLKLDLEHLKMETDVNFIAAAMANEILAELGKKEKIRADASLLEFQRIFSRDVLDKPLILLLDEFDALPEEAINKLAGVFRNIYNYRRKESQKTSGERKYLLHGAALIGVRSVLGIENVKGSPFNVQRSLHIPNLTYVEVEGMFKQYEKENGREVEQQVISEVYRETQGQPGLTCWFGELLTEGMDDFQVNRKKPLTMEVFKAAYPYALYTLPNNNVINIVSKAKQQPYKQLVLEIFETADDIEFSFDNDKTNYLYMNGVIEKEKGDSGKFYIKFSSPFIQKRLFNYFSDALFSYMGRLIEPFANLEDVITDETLHIKNLLKLYQKYLAENSAWLFKEAPRRSDLRVYEAVFHFNLYAYINEFLRSKSGSVWPEFPTGNGKIDLIVRYGGKVYGVELKSYTDQPGYRQALKQAARYGRQLQLDEIFLVFFVESIDDKSRRTYEVDYVDEETKVKVRPVFIETGPPAVVETHRS